MRDQHNAQVTNHDIYRKVGYRLQVNKHFLTMSFLQCGLYNGQSYQRSGVSKCTNRTTFLLFRGFFCVHAPLNQYTTFALDMSDYNWISLLRILRSKCFK